MSEVKFENRVAIVTGGGAGLGREHALALSKYGVKIVVVDLLGADKVAAEVNAAGGEAIAAPISVTDEAAVEKMVADTIEKWGQIDILVNNAGILRDKSFSKMEMDDFRLVVDVHLIGSAICTKAVWNHMKERNFGRIVMTTSSSGMYGNFGQTNYGAAKAGLSGFMRTLCLEGAKYDIRVNALSPFALTAMTDGLFPDAVGEVAGPETVSPGLVYLCCDDAPNRIILCAGASGFAVTKVFETQGITLKGNELTAENIAANWDKIIDETGMEEYHMGGQQGQKFAGRVLGAETKTR